MYIQNLQRMMLDMDPQRMPIEMLYDLQEQVWAKILVAQGSEFYTDKHEPFTYSIPEDESGMQVQRKWDGETIARADIDAAVTKVMELKRNNEIIEEPEQIGGAGITYLFSIFDVMGLLDDE